MITLNRPQALAFARITTEQELASQNLLAGEKIVGDVKFRCALCKEYHGIGEVANLSFHTQDCPYRQGMLR